MRVMFYNSNSLRSGGGGERYILELANRLEKYGISFLIVASKLSVGQAERLPIQSVKTMLDKVSAKYVEFTSLPLSIASSDSPIPLLSEIKKIGQVARDCDLIYFANAHAFQDLLVYGLKKIYERPVISGHHCRLHSFWGKSHDLYLYTLRKTLLRKFDACHVLNSYDLNLLKLLGATNVYLIPNGVDVERFKPRNFEKRGEKFRILFVGTLGSRKGFDMLCESIKMINNNESLQANMDFIIAGGGQLESFAQELTRLYKNVTYLGYVTGDLPKVYRDCDLLVMPSLMETFPLVILEAQASGLPVVAFNIVGPHDILINEITGTLIQEIDSRMLAQKISEYYTLWLNNYEKYKQMRLAARENAEKRFDWGIIVKQIYDMFRQTLERNS